VVSFALPTPEGNLLLDAPSTAHALVRGAEGWVLAAADVLSASASTGLDMSRRAGLLGEVPAGEPVPTDDATVRRLAVTLAAAEAAGVARWCLRTAVAYAGVREQFGRKIGSFQAVKHLCAEMLETAEAVTAAAWDAAAAADGQGEHADEQWSFACDVAEVTCFDGAVEVAKTCIQVLGGIGFTFEHDAHLYLRRAPARRSPAPAAGWRSTSRAATRPCGRPCGPTWSRWQRCPRRIVERPWSTPAC
jgi:alkylation response protein AidB-like acyl-CoA dehydrogenase